MSKISDAEKKIENAPRQNRIGLVLSRDEGIELVAVLRKGTISANALGTGLGLAHGHQIYTLLYRWTIKHCKCEK